MKKVQFSINSEDTTIHFEAEELTEAQSNLIIESLVKKITGQDVTILSPIAATVQTEPIDYSDLQATTLTGIPLKGIATPKKTTKSQVSEGIPSRPRRLPFVDSEHGNYSLAEKFGNDFGQVLMQSKVILDQEKEAPDYFETGIKYREIDGVKTPLYRTRYYCKNPVCNAKGKHYVPENTKTVRCHTCETELALRNASDQGFPNRDGWGNYYIADKLVEMETVAYE